jgi:hypothetical protein
MNKTSITLFSILMLSTQLFGAKINDQLSIGGTYLGIFNNVQFDFATNIDVEYTLSPEFSGLVQLQTGSGESSIGFQGPEAVLTDVALVYAPKNNDITITLGSFDTPFGYQTNHLTNNADGFNNTFILNPLQYAALAGSVGTLNTLGIKAQKQWGDIETIASVSNGTSETSVNKNSTFETLVQISHHNIIQNLGITGTVMNSNDQNDNGGSSLKTNLTAGLVEARYTLTPQHAISGSYGQLRFDDNDNSTKDKVTTYSLNYTHTQTTWFAGLGISQWSPEDNDGNSIGISQDLNKTPGLTTTTVTDQCLTRTQISLGYFIESNILAKAEVFQDNYKHTDNKTGGIAGINVRF